MQHQIPIQLSRLGNKPIKPTKPAHPPELIKPAGQPSALQNLKPGRPKASWPAGWLVDKSVSCESNVATNILKD